MSALPKGWVEAKVNQVSEKLRGVSYDKSEVSRTSAPNKMPILRANNIDNDRLIFEDLVFAPSSRVSEKQRLKPNDVVVAMSSGSKSVVGKTAQLLQEWRGSFGAFCGVLRPSSELDGKYFGYFFRTKEYRSMVSDLSAGTNINNLKKEHFEEIDIPIPPLNEQLRIVAKLEKLLSHVDAAQTRLARILRILKRFRQSVLAAACSGKLTADWRRQNEANQTGADLIASLRTEGPELHFNTFEKSWDVDLPPTWAWVQLGKLGQMRGGGTPSKSNQEFWNGEIPWVSPKDMKRDRIADSEDHITEVVLGNSILKEIPIGSTLFVVRGMILNHTVPVAITDAVVTLNQDMKALIPELQEMSEYLFIASKHIAKAILFNVKEATHGTRRIETPVLKNWAVPLPPLAEQQEIVRRVEALFKTADALEARYLKAKAHIDRLTQSILARAFRGELVPQDSNDEPASALLEHIERERSVEVKKKVRRRI